MRRWFINLPDRDLAYLPEGTQHFDDYVEAVRLGAELRPLQPRDDDGNAALRCAAQELVPRLQRGVRWR